MMAEPDRIPLSELTECHFEQDYLLPERPLIVTEALGRLRLGLDTDELVARFKKKSAKAEGWYEAKVEEAARFASLPSIVSRVLARDDMACRDTPLRVWLHPLGHQTLLHHDGNSVHGFNLQLAGAKEWRLLPPDAQVPMVPLHFVSSHSAGVLSRSRRSGEESYSFRTEPGDMLFLPRYWFHAVRSVEAANVNFNWVFTPKALGPASRSSLREQELLKLVTMCPLLERFAGFELHNYGGVGPALVSEYTRSVHPTRALSRAMKELAGLVPTMLRARSILADVRRLEQNNFREPAPLANDSRLKHNGTAFVRASPTWGEGSP